MGFAAWMTVLASLALLFLSLALLVRTGLLLYRAFRYAWKDGQAWSREFSRYSASLGDSLRSMEERLRHIAGEGHDMRETVDDIRDFLDEMRSHPLLRAARFAGRFRR